MPGRSFRKPSRTWRGTEARRGAPLSREADPNTLHREEEADAHPRPLGCRFEPSFSLQAPAWGAWSPAVTWTFEEGAGERGGREAGLGGGGGGWGWGRGRGAGGGRRGPAPGREAGHVTPAAPARQPGSERRGGPRRWRRARKPGPRGTGRRGPRTAAPEAPMPWRSWRLGWPACAGAWAPSRSTSSSAAAACPRSPASGQVPRVRGRATGRPRGHRGPSRQVLAAPRGCGPCPPAPRRGPSAAPGAPPRRPGAHQPGAASSPVPRRGTGTET